MTYPEPLCKTLERMKKRPGITEGGGLCPPLKASRLYESELFGVVPMHLSIYPTTSINAAVCGKWQTPLRRSSRAFADLAREGTLVCATCLRYWMNKNLDSMEVEP